LAQVVIEVLVRQPAPLLAAEPSEEAVNLPTGRVRPGLAESVDERGQALPFSVELALFSNHQVYWSSYLDIIDLTCYQVDLPPIRFHYGSLISKAFLVFLRIGRQEYIAEKGLRRLDQLDPAALYRRKNPTRCVS